MNRIAFDLQLVKAADEPFVQDYFALGIHVDDRDLLEYVRATEMPFAAAEGHPDLAGKYAALPAFMALESLAAQGVEKVSLYDCDCGCFGCWPLRVSVAVSENTVAGRSSSSPIAARTAGPAGGATTNLVRLNSLAASTLPRWPRR